MRAIPQSSQLFSADQQHSWTVSFWDTPFTALEGDVASGGIIMDVVEPKHGGDWKAYVDAMRAAAINTPITSFTTHAQVTAPVTNGRTDNVIGYWAAGAPGHHGVTVSGRVGYHFQAKLRTPTARAWFSNAATPTWFLAVAGNGWVRIDKKVGATTTTIFNQLVTEKDYLISGYAVSSQLSNMSAGDQLDIYYVQTGVENWGGFVVKAVPGSLGTDAANQLAAQDAPVLSCGLADDGVPPTKVTLTSYRTIDIDRQLGKPMTAELTLPLVTPGVHDGTGWEWKKDSSTDPGYLQLWDGGQPVTSVKRRRLVQIVGGYVGEQYPLFTGLVEDFSAPDGGQVNLTLRGVELKLLEQHDKNYPDPVSYMAAGYRQTSIATGTLEPIYGIPAYDNWSLERAVRDLCVRCGADPSQLQRNLAVAKSDGSTTSVQYDTDTFRKFRARTMNGKLLRMERPVHYGNAGIGFDESSSPDDPYIFKPEVSKELYQRARELCDRVGYDFWFDEEGHTVLTTRNMPSRVYDLTVGDTTGSAATKTHPSAYAAQYLEWTGSVATVTKTVVGARVDVSLPVGPSLGAWAYTVKRQSDNVQVSSGILTPGVASAQVFFYDGTTAADGSNATTTTLYSGEYDAYVVTLTASGGAATRRADCLFAYHTDPSRSKYPSEFSTSLNALRVQALSAMADMRNSVTIVGRRKATVTDSDKFNTNPENPEGEFIVARAVDKRSITDPTAENYVGAQKEALIFDDTITDLGYAQYLARVFLYRYRLPRPAANIEHTFMPVLQFRDPINAVEARHHSITVDSVEPTKTVLWVTGFRHRYDGARAITSITTSSFPEFPSFEPREDIDLSIFNYRPAVNVSVGYTSLAGDVRTNQGHDVVYRCVESETRYDGYDVAEGEWVTLSGIAVTPGTPDAITLPPYTPWPPIPGTLFIRPVVSGPMLAGAPYVTVETPAGAAPRPTLGPGRVLPPLLLQNRAALAGSDGIDWVHVNDGKATRSAMGTRNGEFFYEVSDDDYITIGAGKDFKKPRACLGIVRYQIAPTDFRLGWITNNPYHHFLNIDYRDAQKKISLPWNHGDNISAVFHPLYQRNTDVTSFDVRFRRLGPTNGAGAFQDPYSGGSPFYDPYTSELGYLVNIQADLLVSGLYRVSIRNADDGTVVAWLTEPRNNPEDPAAHWEYYTAASQRSWAWDGVDDLGSWNSKQSIDYAVAAAGAFEETQRVIGRGFYVWNQERVDGALGPLALIAGLRDSTGKPVFGHGTFAKWYVHIECKADGQTLKPTRSDQLDPEFNGDSDAALIYTHLPTPTQAEVAFADWTSATAFDPDDVGAASAASGSNVANWNNGQDTAVAPSGAPDADATTHNAKPVRLRFRVADRPGPLWAGKQSEVSVRLTRHVHLRALIMDQAVSYDGTNFPGSPFEQRSIYNRRLVNDTHTITYADATYRKASSLRWANSDTGTEWVFYPSEFRKNFRGYEEPIAFGDYLQLEEVPRWNDSTRRSIAGARSRLNLAFMAYLFYLSGYVSDRSGRSCWAVNRQFLDKSKICNNQYGDWWDPANPQVAATSSTFRTEPIDDPARQFRRSVFVRQWTNEPGWQAAQRSKFGITANSIGDHLLRHKWKDHSINSTTINGVAWSSLTGLTVDAYSDWHAYRAGSGTPNRPSLPSTYRTLTRQLPSSLGTGWAFESAPEWYPCITRDFHGYYLVPPMVDRNEALHVGANDYMYEQVDVREWSGSEKNEGDDTAAGEVWSSPVFDMTQTPTVSDNNSRVRFWPGTKVAASEWPMKDLGITAATLNYVRQDELVHWEDLRGIYSRGRRPQEAPVKVSPIQPYQMDVYKYQGIAQFFARNNQRYPRFGATVLDWFHLTFRREYFWESGTFFPVSREGAERLEWMNYPLTRFIPNTAASAVAYDSGAWVGWKDDRDDNVIGFAASIGGVRFLTPFESGVQVVGNGPRMSVTTDMVMHMVLVPERRGTAV